jgi:hypothetical protein
VQADLNTVLIVIGFAAGIWRTEHLNTSIIGLAEKVGKLSGQFEGVAKDITTLTTKVDALPGKVIHQ